MARNPRTKLFTSDESRSRGAEFYAHADFTRFGWLTDGRPGAKDPSHDLYVKIYDSKREWKGLIFGVEVKYIHTLRRSADRRSVLQRVDAADIIGWRRSDIPYFLVVYFNVPDSSLRPIGVYFFVSGLPTNTKSQREIGIPVPMNNALNSEFAKERIWSMVENLKPFKANMENWDLNKIRSRARQARDYLAEGAALLAQGKMEKGATLIIQARHTDDRALRAYLTAGEFFVQTTQYQKAARAFEKAARCRGVTRADIVRVLRGGLVPARKRGRDADAMRMARRLLKRAQQGDRGVLLYELAMIAHRRSRFREAVRLLAESETQSDLVGQLIARTQRAAVLIDSEQYEAAHQVADEARVVFKGLPEPNELAQRWLGHSYKYRALAEAYQGRLADAKASLQECVGIFKGLGRRINVPSEKLCEALIFLKEGKMRDGERAITAAIKDARREGVPGYLAEYWTLKGMCLDRQRKYMLAQSCYRKAISIGPRDSNLRGISWRTSISVNPFSNQE